MSNNPGLAVDNDIDREPGIFGLGNGALVRWVRLRSKWRMRRKRILDYRKWRRNGKSNVSTRVFRLEQWLEGAL